MNIFTLSPRLELASSYALKGEDFWDIGCDHGYLGMAALAKQKASFVYFVDPSKSVMDKLDLKFPQQLDRSKIEMICQDARQIKNKEVKGCVAIMGMGGKLIFEILDLFIFPNSRSSLRLILQAQTFDLFLEESVLQRGFKLIEQESISDKRDTRRVLIFEKI